MLFPRLLHSFCFPPECNFVSLYTLMMGLIHSFVLLWKHQLLRIIWSVCVRFVYLHSGPYFNGLLILCFMFRPVEN